MELSTTMMIYGEQHQRCKVDQDRPICETQQAQIAVGMNHDIQTPS